MTAVVALLAVWAAATVLSWRRPPAVLIPRKPEPKVWTVRIPLPDWARRDRPPDWEGSWFGAGISPWPSSEPAAPPVDLWGLNEWPSAYGGQTAELPRVVA